MPFCAIVNQNQQSSEDIMKQLALLTIFSTTLLACGEKSEDTSSNDTASDTTDTTDTTDTVSTSDGQALVEEHCVLCHIQGYAPQFASLVPSKTDEEIQAAIANGGTGSGQMPAGLVSGEEVTAVIGYLRETYP